MLLMSQLKKSYQDEEKTQQSFLQEIGITRKSLRSNYRKMQLGEDIQIESPKHDTESGYDTSVKDDDSDLNDKECKHADPDILDKVDEDQTDDLEKDVQTESHDETNVNENIQDEEIVSEQKSVNQKIFSEPLSENVKKAKSKIDTRWNRDGIIYKQIKTGFKSKAEITDSSKVAKELKKLRQSNSTTGNSQAYNVYMEDVHQRYMQSLQNQAKTRNEFSNIQHSKKVSRPKTERVNTHKVDEQLSERPHTDGHRSQSPNRNITAFEGNTDKPKHTNQNGRIANVHRPKQKIQKGGIDSRIPVRTSPYEKPKVRMKESETDRDFARLERDKKITNGYQDYMDNQETLPNIEGPGRKTFNTNRLTNNRRANANSTRAMKLKGMEFSTNGGYADNDSHNIGQSPKNEKTPKQLENHKVFHVNETINKHVDGLDSRGESVQSHAGSSKSTTSSRRSKIPIGKAVEIMQTRNKFYEEAAVEKVISLHFKILGTCSCD